ncbi:MAG: DUF3473 domain-containing protein [Bacteroidetes bacterium]|nr:MAG: DUF3473 domain-containing protein [Bacteroidota bacterium]
MKRKYLLLSFDVEEFDMPLEYGQQIPVPLQMETGKKGWDAVNQVLTQLPSTQATLFTTANYALQFPDSIQQAAKCNEIASHTFYHTAYETGDLLKSRLALEGICGKAVTGLRMPRLRPVDMADVEAAGYTYDSSINPTWLPGRYNNLHLSRTWYREKNMLRIPASVSVARIPLFWLAFKNMPLAVYKKLCAQALKTDGYLCLYFHPWEFTNLDAFQIPGYTKRWAGEVLVDRLYNLLQYLQTETESITMQEFSKLCK